MKIYQDYEETDWSIIWREYEESRKSSHWEQLELDIQNKSSEELLLRIKWLNKLIVEKQNGIELEDISPKSIEMTIKNLNEMRNELSVFSKNAMANARQFSYEQYNHRILNEILQN